MLLRKHRLIPSVVAGVAGALLTWLLVDSGLKAYLLAYNEHDDQWTLESGFDGDELLQRPGIELVAIEGDTAAGTTC